MYNAYTQMSDRSEKSLEYKAYSDEFSLSRISKSAPSQEKGQISRASH